MNSFYRQLLGLLLLLLVSVEARPLSVYRPSINLAGTWLLDGGTDSVALPGTTDTNRKGTPLARFDETTRLSRRYSFEGVARYSREVDIPKSWKGMTISLTLERTKSTRVFVDGNYAGCGSSLSTAQTLDLTSWLTPGRHTISIDVDNTTGGNAIPKQLFVSSHACSEDTQTNWNGIIGRISLDARPAVFLDSLSVIGTPERPIYTFHVEGRGKIKGNFCLRITDMRSGKLVYSVRQPISLKARAQRYGNYIPLMVPLQKWSDENPALYRASIVVDGVDSIATTFAFSRFRADGNHFTINGTKTFLRGKHDACVFPLTGHTPMDRQSWNRYFATLKDYGINHVRFHSWCPPEECFAAADSAGMYLQPELPFWGDFNAGDTTLMNYLHAEGERILRSYGRHPSFVMMALGNELWGSIDAMRRFADDFRAVDSTKVYTFGANYYLGYKGAAKGMDYFITCRNGEEQWGQYTTHTRGSFSFADAADGGMINHQYPNTLTNFDDAIGSLSIPVISHETGQFQMYPDFGEIGSYTGVLRPCNMEAFKARLDAAGMGDEAKAFLEASGKWAVELYKADIEMDLRTRRMAGFQLLDLQDYPGQGSAYVGILNAFMESKKLVKPERWREWCSAVVPLMEMPRFCYTDGEHLQGRIKIASYAAQPCLMGKVTWRITDQAGNQRDEGSEIVASGMESGLIPVGDIDVPLRLRRADESEQLTLTLSIDGTNYRNSWKLWVYPSEDYSSRLKALGKGIVVCDSLTGDIVRRLESGAKVLLMPRKDMYHAQSLEGMLQTDFWNYRMFKTICDNNHKPVSPGTLGILVEPSHPLLRNFPTANHSDWQWADIVKNARPFILDATPKDYRPIVQVIDNVERNHKLGIVFEFSVGKGRLLVCTADMTRLASHPESRRFHLSLLEYMQSGDFAPATRLSAEAIARLFSEKAKEVNMGELRNISFE